MDFREQVAALVQARRVAAAAWRDMLISVDKFRDAETLFNWRTDHVMEKHNIPTGKPLTVEALRDRDLDEQWKNAVTDCTYFRDRAAMFAAVYQAARAQMDGVE